MGTASPSTRYYLSWKAREFDFHTKFIELAADIEPRAWPSYVVRRIYAFMNRLGKTLSGARVLCLGASFKTGRERHPQLPGDPGHGAASTSPAPTSSTSTRTCLRSRCPVASTSP